MKKMVTAICLGLIMLCASSAMADVSQIGELLKNSNAQFGKGQKEQAYKSMDQALQILWQNTGLWVDEALLVSEPAGGMGIYSPRPNNTYAQGEPIFIYAKPMGYKHHRLDNGIYEFGVTTDFYILRPNGKVLAGQEKFQRLHLRSHKQARELFINLTYNISGLPPGEYKLKTVLHDIVNKATVSFENDIIIE